MNSKRYGRRRTKFKIASYRLGLLDSMRDNILKNRIRENATRNEVTSKNYGNRLEEHLYHSGRPNVLNTENSKNFINRNLMISDTIYTTNENVKANEQDKSYLYKHTRSTSLDISNKQFDRNHSEEKQSSLITNNSYCKPSTSGKTCANKQTYCRPVYDFYNQEFVYKSMARDQRLQQLLKKMICVRQREKQLDTWNNFINNLRNKHACTFSEERDIASSIYQDTISPEVIDDYYNTRFNFKESNQYNNLLNDFYSVHDNIHSSNYCKAYDYNCQSQYSGPGSCSYKNYSFCYPTSSQARLRMWNRERDINKKNDDWCTRPLGKYYPGSALVVDNNRCEGSINTKNLKQTLPKINPIASASKRVLLNSSAMQTESKILPRLTIKDTNGDIQEDIQENIKEDTVKEKYNQVSKNVERLKQKIDNTRYEVQSPPLTNIENKLNILIQSINAFIDEIKINNELKKSIKSSSVSCQFSDSSEKNLNCIKSDICEVFKCDKIVCGIAQNVSRGILALDGSTNREATNKPRTSQIEDILSEELDKSNRVRKDIDDIINRKSDRPCAVQFTFDIPTRETATEVTASLSKARLNVDKSVIVEEISAAKDGRMTMAVNTDPLGVLALLKVSTETVKQIISYMHQIDYYSLLPMIQFPQSRGSISHYVCSICRESFGRPSQLSEHIRDHNLANPRDCCVCRHAMDLKRQKSGVFPCRYCGHQFTRAYCCQLHENSCAKRHGAKADVTSSLMILR